MPSGLTERQTSLISSLPGERIGVFVCVSLGVSLSVSLCMLVDAVITLFRILHKDIVETQ